MKSMFSQLLSYNNLILLEIVDIVGSSNVWVSSEELAKKLSLSLRTIQRYISQLESIIIKYKEKREITLESHRGKGIRFSTNSDSNRLFLKEYIYQEDETVKLLHHLLVNNVESKKSYCKRNNISAYSTSFNDSIEKIESILIEYNLSIADGKLIILGEETQIRRFSYVFFWNLYKFDPSPDIFERVNLKSIEKSLDYFIIENNFSMNSIVKKEVIVSIVISVLRYDLGNFVQIKEEWIDYIPHNHLPTLTESVTKMFQDQSIKSKNEINFFLLCMLTRPYTYEPTGIREKLVRYIRKDTYVYKATELAVRSFSRGIHTIPPSDYENALIYIYRSHLSAHMFKYEGNDSNGSIFYDTFFLEDILGYFEDFVDRLYIESKNKIFLSKDYLAKRYYVLASTFDETLIMGPKIEIWIETDLPFMYESIVKDMIKNRFAFKYNISFLSNTYIKKPDVKIATALYRTERESSDTIVYIDSLLETQDFERIESAIRRVLIERRNENK